MGEQADARARMPWNVGAPEPRAWVRPSDMPDMAPVSQLVIAYPFLTVLWFVGVMSVSPVYEFLVTTPHSGLVLAGCSILTFLAVNAGRAVPRRAAKG